MVTAARVACDAEGRIDADLFCATCGHNLRGLEPSGVCTECGSLVEWSLGDGTLRFADPQWVRKLRTGVTWVMLTLPWLWLPLAWPLFFWGFWRLTTRAPQERQVDAAYGLAAIRAGPPMVLVAALVSIEVVEALQPWSAADFAQFAGALAWAIVAVLIGLAVRRVGRRADSRRLRGWSDASILLNGAALGLLVLGAVNAALGSDVLLLIAAAAVGGLVTATGVIPLVVMLFIAWAELESAEIHSRAIRREMRPWLRPEPGSSFLRRPLPT
jgi:hypothetical protein